MATYGHTFTSGDTLTPTKLNNARTVTDIVNADIKSDAAIAGSKLADTSVAPAKLSQPLTFETAKATTSGISIEFTGIPSWAKRITVTLNGVSTSGGSVLLAQLGTSDGMTIAGYTGLGTYSGTSANISVASTAGIPIGGNSTNAQLRIGTISFHNHNANVWVASYAIGMTDGTPYSGHGGGSVALAGTLDRLRIVASNGTDTFDSGSINISYEG